MKDIYSDPKCNTKSRFYGTGSLGPPHLFTNLDGGVHRSLRKALGGPQVPPPPFCLPHMPTDMRHWSVGGFKNNWEPCFDSHVQPFVRRMSEFVEKNEPVILSDKVACVCLSL